MAFNDDSFDRLNSRVSELHTDKAIATKDQGLIYLLLAQKFLREADEINESYVDGGNDCGVDAIYIDRRPDQPVIHIIQSKFHESKRKAGNAFKASCLEKIYRFFEIVKNPKIDLSKVVNTKLEQKILEIRDVQKTDFPEFKVWLISNGQPCTAHEIEPLVKPLSQQDIKVAEFHLTDFIEFCINRRSTREQHIFRVREVGVIESGDTELYTVVGYISARELYGILKDLRNERKMDYSLFDMNVRGFLGMDSPVNQEIFKSASSLHNHNFSSLNNGITIVGSDVKVMKTGDIPKIGVKNMSIVNGAQTCSAIFDSMKDQFPSTEKFDKLSVLFRLFKTDDSEMIEKIALSTNSQNRIHPRDLRANDKFQISLEASLKDRGIIYQRKRGGVHLHDVGAARLDALKAGQLLLSYVYHDPAAAKKQSDQIFGPRYNKIFGSVDVDKLVRAHKFYSKIEEKQKFISDEIRIRGISRTENTFVTYGGFHILTLCSVLSEFDSDKDDDETIVDAIEVIAQVLSEVGQPAYYSFFRNTEMTEKMIEKCSQPDLI